MAGRLLIMPTRLLLLLALLNLAASCGQKGPLTAPEPPATPRASGGFR